MNTGSLTPPQEIAVFAIASGKSIVDAAKEAGVRRQQVHEWMKRDEFRAALSETRRAVFQAAMSGLCEAAAKATAALVAILKDENAPPAARVSAARAILDGAFRANGFDELESRIEALERAMETPGGSSVR